jgi:hypothetical protein
MVPKILRYFTGSKNGKHSENLFVPHVVAWEYGILVIAWSLFLFYISASAALDDTMKFDHTHTFLHFQYNFREHQCLEYYFTLQTVVVEWVLYLVLYRQAKSRGKIWGGMLYFTAAMILHIGICLHANSLYPNSLPDEVWEAGLAYLSFANITVSPPVVYCIVYLWHICKLRKAYIGTKESSSAE